MNAAPPRTMRGAFLMGPRSIEVRDVPIPEIAADEVLVEVTTALTCGTELKAYRQGHRLFKPPMALGHEFTGLVSKVGSDVTGFAPGDRVVAANSAPCLECPMCRIGKTNLCTRLPEFLLFGAFAEFVRISGPIARANLLKLPADVPDHRAAFLEPFACVVQGNAVASPQPGESVVVIGGTGPIGLLFVQLLRLSGAGRILTIGRNPKRLELAARLGATDPIAARESLVEDIRNVLPGGADLVIEITGIPELIEQAAEMVRPGGRVILFGGSTPGSRASFDLGRLHYEEVSIRGVFHHTPASVRRSLELLVSGQIDVDPLVSGRYSLEDSALAMKEFDSGRTMKLAIAPGGRPPLVG